jgi:hypothetical protein
MTITYEQEKKKAHTETVLRFVFDSKINIEIYYFYSDVLSLIFSLNQLTGKFKKLEIC